jgi:uncharacterized protein with FMN-binding domain
MEVYKLKKLLAIAVSASFIMSSMAFAAETPNLKKVGPDVVSAATGEATPAPKPAPKPTTPKTTTPKKTTKPATTSVQQPAPKVELLPTDEPNKYIDGFYSTYGTASIHGAERADVQIKNGALVDVKLYKLNANLRDGKETYSYKKVFDAAPVMEANFLNKGSYFPTGSVDTVSGATASSNGWNVAIQRAYAKAAKAAPKTKYFDGSFTGVDSNTRVLVSVDIQNNKATKVSTYLFGPNDNILADYELTPTQKEIIASLNVDLLKNNVRASSHIEGAESIWAAAREAYVNLLANASTK